ncbi:MAG: hypothetical protein H7Y41_01560 [Hyphomonadaceae bacterium]|nr:hypothetical protein [Clostridia bacterium]
MIKAKASAFAFFVLKVLCKVTLCLQASKMSCTLKAKLYSEDWNMKICPYCQNNIKDEMKKCPFCGSTVALIRSSFYDQSAPLPQVEHLLNQTDTPIAFTQASPYLANGVKVFVSIIATIPFIGQIVAIICAIVWMNAKDQDRKSFGSALLSAGLILFFLTCMFCFGYLMIVAVINSGIDLNEIFNSIVK